jgi:DNA-binding NarL/FixJ family response regulator
MPITLVIADDHPLILDALENLFRLERDFKVVARCLDGDEALKALRRHKPEHLGARHSDAGKRRPYGAPGDEERETVNASRGSHG